MFKRNHHVRIAAVLQALNAEYLRSHHCLFGGGTAIVLSHGEYRESLDIDFLCSDLEKYREVREDITGRRGFRAIAHDKLNVTANRIRADQYGIRTIIEVGDVEIKFEIVFEARIVFDAPTGRDKICGIATLSKVDMGASKLLANSDRWADPSVFNRDLIDLAMLDLSKEDFKKAYDKATHAYGTSVGRDLERAIQRLKQDPNRLDQSMDALQITSVAKAVLWKKIRKLVPRGRLTSSDGVP